MNNLVQVDETIYTVSEVLTLIEDIQKDIDDGKISSAKIEVINTNNIINLYIIPKHIAVSLSLPKM